MRRTRPFVCLERHWRDQAGATDPPSASPSVAPSATKSGEPSLLASMELCHPSLTRTFMAVDVLVSVLAKDGLIPPMPDDVNKIFGDTLNDFLQDSFGERRGGRDDGRSLAEANRRWWRRRRRRSATPKERLAAHKRRLGTVATTE